MLNINIEKMEIWEHKEKQGGKYPHNDTYVVMDYIRMKSPESGEWYDGVLYMSTTKGEYFCREKNDFIEKFKEVDYDKGRSDNNA